MSKSEFRESGTGYMEKVVSKVMEEDFGIHISLTLGEADEVTDITMNTNIPDKDAMLAVIQTILQSEGYTVTPNE